MLLDEKNLWNPEDDEDEFEDDDDDDDDFWFNIIRDSPFLLIIFLIAECATWFQIRVISKQIWTWYYGIKETCREETTR